MGWVLSMAVVEGLSAEAVAGRLEAELGEETTGDSDSGEESGAGPGLPAVGVHGDGRAVSAGACYHRKRCFPFPAWA